MKQVLFFSSVVFMLLAQASWGQVPETVSYQGILTNASGIAVPDGKYKLTFNLYTSDIGGAPLWTEGHLSVAVIKGIFNVILGSAGSPLSLPFTQQYWLGVTVGAGPELTPRIKLTSSPYSLNARSIADGAVTTTKIANSAVTSGKIASGQVVKSVNSLKDDVTLAPGTNVTITPGGNTLTISATSSDAWKLTGNAGTTPGTHFLGTTDNQALDLRVNNARILRLEPNATSPNILGGFNGNSITSGVYGATISGGGKSGFINRVTDNYSTVGGGYDNQAGDNAGTADDAYYATVSGGKSNKASNQYATVSGGWSNQAGNVYATVGGGYSNNASANSATISGGYNSSASANCATIGGGYSNDASAGSATISGGRDNTASGSYATIGGGHSNQAIADYATIGGGGRSDPNSSSTSNRVKDSYGTIGGGGNNQAGDDETAYNNASYATVGGGKSNKAINEYATVGGGVNNTVSGAYSVIAGGVSNDVTGNYSFIGGGDNNQATKLDTTVGGGFENKATGEYSTISGGWINEASGQYATIPGGAYNGAQGDYSFAAGRHAKANGNGCFVWGDYSTSTDITASGDNQFKARTSGGVWFYSTSDLTKGVRLEAGGTGWIGFNTSDKALKYNIRSVDGRDILTRLAQIPISRWSYQSEEPKIEHVGPMAQDFYAAFGAGEDDKHISTVDAEGVALAAIQGLYEIVREKDAENAALRQRVDDLEARLAELEALVK